jgi:antirestriction protein ArdC
MTQQETYEKVTDSIIQAMEDGLVPWRKPWSDSALALPTSLATGKPYRGINSLILSLTEQVKGYSAPLWGTYKQFQSLGGQVQKGEKSTAVVLWKPMERINSAGEVERWMLMRTFNVFNIGQTDLPVPDKYTAKREPVAIYEGVTAALAYPGGPVVQYGGNRAVYSPTLDTITLPDPRQFFDSDGFAATALHEITHSTGHSSRLDRLEPGAFGCETYAKEELVAEIGAAMLATVLGIYVEWPQHAAYLSGWLKALKDDRSLLVKAAQAAQKAVDVVLPSQVAVAAAA